MVSLLSLSFKIVWAVLEPIAETFARSVGGFLFLYFMLFFLNVSLPVLQLINDCRKFDGDA